MAVAAGAARQGDAPAGEPGDAAREVVAATNELRRSGQLQPLSVHPALQAAALAFADYMARSESYGHEADGRTPTERVRGQGYNYCAVAENIGRVQRASEVSGAELARAFVDGWMASPPHRQAMLGAEATETGVAVVRSKRNGLFYGVQLIARPRTESITVQVANRGPLGVRYEIGERTYSLASRSVHTHTLCSASLLVMTFPGGAVGRVMPVDGQRYSARQTSDGRWTLMPD